ncbi:hypothetical protein VHUM_00779 [Vanrija humicola]|uniref:Amino acid permease/ SLC12A domain-containing protein n=1 Tax=Vanrija humicola TaxID=5417 RepID=A0A7D8Z5U8_VANHU|nr:hypothetical protein VHUM_00779 [Vanrija humicola]
MIAIAGTIGTGLFLGSGAALTLGGPVGAWLAYLIMGILVCGMMYSLHRRTCFAPNVGGFIEMGTRYVDPAFGFMMGINYILQTGLTFPGELSAIAILISYWDDNAKHAGAYITAFLIATLLMNIVGVKYYGEIEFFFAVIKITMLIALILFGLVANLGGIPPKREFIGGRFWRDEPFNDSFLGLQPVSLSRFLGFWAVFTKAAFSYLGIEAIAVLAGEAHNPRQTMRMAVRTVFYRIVGIYVIAILIIGLTVSQHSPELLHAVELGGQTAASSPFVVICIQMGVKVFPSVINAVVITSALSCGNENVYALSRTLMALAKQGYAPKIFLTTDKRGVPLAGVLVAMAFGLLSYLSLSKGSNQAFLWLTNLSALSTLVGWVSICFCFVRFKKALELQGIDRRKLILRSWFQPYMAWTCISFFTLVLIFNGFTNFIHRFNAKGFVASYITMPVIFVAYAGFKLWTRSKVVRLDEIDLSNGPAEALEGTRYDRNASMFVPVPK